WHSTTSASQCARSLGSVLPRVPARAIDRRHLSAHRTEVRGQLTAMMNRIEEEVPDRFAEGTVHHEFVAEVHGCGFFPLRVVNGCECFLHVARGVFVFVRDRR